LRINPNWSKRFFYSQINQKQTNRINSYICKNAERFVLSKNKEYLLNLCNSIDFNKIDQEKNRKNIYFNKDIGLIANYNYYPA